MKTVMHVTIAGSAALAASAASAQFGFDCSPNADLCVYGVFTPEPNEYELEAEFRGDLPAGTTAISTIWSDVGFTLTGDAPITITDWNPGFNSMLFGQPQITGNGTNQVTFVAVMPSEIFGTPDSSNPLSVIDFTYTGSTAVFFGEFVGQNSALFAGDPAAPFGSPVLYQDAQGNPGPLVAEFRQVPTPGTLAIAPLALLAARRRRK